MSGSIKFFDCYMRPKDIIMNTMTSEEIKLKKQNKLEQYEYIYKNGFCKAYGIECTNRDVDSFLFLVNKHILNRHNPEGVDYRPIGSMVRLWIAPHSASVKLGVSSYDINYDYDKEFKKFQENLESKLK